MHLFLKRVWKSASRRQTQICIPFVKKVAKRIPFQSWPLGADSHTVLIALFLPLSFPPCGNSARRQLERLYREFTCKSLCRPARGGRPMFPFSLRGLGEIANSIKNGVSPRPRVEKWAHRSSPRAGPSSDLHVNSRCKRLTRHSLRGLGDTSNSIKNNVSPRPRGENGHTGARPAPARIMVCTSNHGTSA